MCGIGGRTITDRRAGRHTHTHTHTHTQEHRQTPHTGTDRRTQAGTQPERELQPYYVKPACENMIQSGTPKATATSLAFSPSSLGSCLYLPCLLVWGQLQLSGHLELCEGDNPRQRALMCRTGSQSSQVHTRTQWRHIQAKMDFAMPILHRGNGKIHAGSACMHTCIHVFTEEARTARMPAGHPHAFPTQSPPPPPPPPSALSDPYEGSGTPELVYPNP